MANYWVTGQPRRNRAIITAAGAAKGRWESPEYPMSITNRINELWWGAQQGSVWLKLCVVELYIVCVVKVCGGKAGKAAINGE